MGNRKVTLNKKVVNKFLFCILLVLILVAGTIPYVRGSRADESPNLLKANGISINDEESENLDAEDYEMKSYSASAIVDFEEKSKSSGVVPVTGVSTKDANKGVFHARYVGITGSAKVEVRYENRRAQIYHISPGKEYTAIPLSHGSGKYRIRMLESVMEKRDYYRVIYDSTIEVNLENSLDPFRQSGYYIDSSTNSYTAKLAREIVKGCSTEGDKVEAIYDYIVHNVSYDNNLASNPPANYKPLNERTLSNGKGICIDYAALMTSMCRSQGIPAKMVSGNVDNGEFHAWVEVYISDGSSIPSAVGGQANGWTLIDPTYGSNATYRDVGSNYNIKQRNYYTPVYYD